MRRNELEIKDREAILDIINQAEICRIALYDDEYPYIVPLNFGFEEKTGLILYFHCARKGKKLDLIRQNNKVCFEIESHTKLESGNKPCNWSMRYKSVIGFGTIDIIRDESEKIRGLNILMRHYAEKEVFQYNKALLRKTLILKLIVSHLSAKSHG